MSADQENPYRAPKPEDDESGQRRRLSGATIFGAVVTNLVIIFGFIIPGIHQASLGNRTPIVVTVASVAIIALVIVFVPFKPRTEDTTTGDSGFHPNDSSPQ